MYPQIDLFSTNVGLFRNLGTLTIAGYEELMAKHLESGEALFSRNLQKLKTGLSQTSTVTNPQEWLQAVQSIVQNSIDTANEDMRTALDCQRQTNRVIEKQAEEVQQVVTDVLKGIVASSEKLKSDKRSVQKTAA